METNVFDRRPGRTLATILESNEGETYVVDPTTEMLGSLVDVAGSLEAPPPIRVLSSGRVVRRVMDDFLVGSAAAELVAEGVLAIRTREGDDDPSNPLVVTESAVYALVRTDGGVAGLAGTDEEFVGDAHGTFARAFEAAAEFDLRTPPLSRVRETLTADIGPDASEDFSEVLASLDTVRGDDGGVDEVTVSLLVAAKNDHLFYDISRWGEDAGVASKATFSREKGRLEEAGLLETRKVPGSVGRPRQRLALADDRLREADNDQLASVAESILS